ncbi:hypothetical protein RV10_GL002733 [Enterococcus pallens]|nr:hypothetical protein RV10_GL002733 [Enterococcus pallens]
MIIRLISERVALVTPIIRYERGCDVLRHSLFPTISQE